MDGTYVDHAYAEHLTDTDLELLATASGAAGTSGGAAAALRRDPPAISRLLGHPAAFEAVYGRSAVRAGRPALVSPFLAVAAAVHRAAAELPSMTHVVERTGPPQRAPELAAPTLARCLESQQRGQSRAELHGTRGGSGSARWIRPGSPGCSTPFPRGSGPACTAGSVTSRCSSPGSSPTTRSAPPSGRSTSSGCCATPAWSGTRRRTASRPRPAWS